MKTNEGEVSQYYVENSHPAIIAPEIFDAVQAEMTQRKQLGRRNYTPHCFSGKIYCDECGSLYGSKTWHKQTVWTCNARSKGETHCKTPALRNATIEAAFIRAISQTIAQKDEIIRICEDTMCERCDTNGINLELEKLHIELDVMTEMMQRTISVNAQMALDQAEYKRQFDEYEASYNETKTRISTLE